VVHGEFSAVFHVGGILMGRHCGCESGRDEKKKGKGK